MFQLVLMTSMICQCVDAALTDFALRVVPVVRQRDDVTRCRVGLVVAENVTVFSLDKIVELSRLKPERVIRDEDLSNAGDLIRRAYLDLGYLRVSVSVDRLETHRALSPVLPSVDLAIRIKEGPVFTLRRLEFVGNDKTRDQIIRRQVLQQEGEPYRQRLVDQSLIRINRLGLFEKLTMKNVLLELDEREQFVDVLVRFKEKGRAPAKKAVAL